MTEVMQLETIESLPVLQDAIKRDPAAYKQEFEYQFAAFQTQCELFEANPQRLSNEFVELLMFIAHTAGFYQMHQNLTRAEEFARTVLRLIKGCLTVEKPVQLKSLFAAIVLLDNKSQLDRFALYQEFIGFLGVENSDYGVYLTNQLVKGLSSVKAPDQIKKWQTLVFNAFRSAKKALLASRLNFVLIRLYLCGAWKDQQTANMIAEGVFHKSNKVVETSARFILGDLKRLSITAMDQGVEAPVDEEETRAKQADLIQQLTKELSTPLTSKHRKSKKKLLKLKEQAEKNLQKLEGKANKHEGLTFEIMDRLYDPHSFVERLYARFVKPPKRVIDGVENRDSFKIKLLCFTVAARCIGKYEILLPGFLDFFAKYINPKQDQITRILALLAQAVHQSTPLGELQKCVRSIADAFVVDSCPVELITIGINAIREMAARNIRALTPEFLEDLVEYGNTYRDVTVKAAAASLRNLYRQQCPDMLPKKFQGRQGVTKDLGNSNETGSTSIEGLDILMRLRRIQKKRKHDEIDEEDDLDPVTLGAQKILSEKDFNTLKKIKLKNVIAKSVGLNLADWLNANDAWNILAGKGENEKLKDNVDKGAEAVDGKDHKGESTGDEDSDSDEASDDDEAQIEEDGSDASGTSDGDELRPLDDEKSTEDADDSLSLESDSDEEEEEEQEEVAKPLIGDDLKGKQKFTREQLRELRQQTKRSRQRERKEVSRSGRKDRAGITNRTAARNKPMAMLRQKNANREKASMDAKAKVKHLKAHIKTLKTQIKQKMRRR